MGGLRVFADPHVHVRQRDRRTWELLDPLDYSGRWETFTVPAGFVTDFATVPRPVVWLIPTYGVYTPAAILHDFLCEAARSATPLLSRRDADGLFRRSLRELGVSAPKRWAMWAAVRAGSRLSGATPGEVVRFLAVALPAVAFLLVPVTVVTLWLVLAWLVEGVWWLLTGAGTRTRHPDAELTRLRT